MTSTWPVWLRRHAPEIAFDDKSALLMDRLAAFDFGNDPGATPVSFSIVLLALELAALLAATKCDVPTAVPPDEATVREELVWDWCRITLHFAHNGRY